MRNDGYYQLENSIKHNDVWYDGIQIVNGKIFIWCSSYNTLEIFNKKKEDVDKKVLKKLLNKFLIFNVMNELEMQTLSALKRAAQKYANADEIEINWEQRRYEIAKDIFCRNEITADVAVECADELIAELKKTKTN